MISRAESSATSNRPATTALPLIAVCLGFFMVMLDTTIVNVALPSIGRDLAGGVDLLQWVVDSYTVVFAAFLLSAGAAGDIIGPRRIYIVGLVVFAVFSAVCAAAPSGGALIAARAFQGLGAAALVPGSLALINATYSNPSARAKAIGIWGGMGGIAAALGPVVGGALVATAGWQAVFLVNVPVAAAAYWLVTRYVVNPRPEHKRDLDLFGQILAIAALGCLTYAIIEGGGHSGWTIIDTGLIVIGVVLGAARPDAAGRAVP
jgi:DHA2 family methylenomycin A resistance protein-like MFS transporter